MELKTNRFSEENLVLENSNDMDAVRWAVNFAARSIPFWRIDQRTRKDELTHTRIMLAGAIRRGYGIGEGLPTEPSALTLSVRETELALDSMKKFAATKDGGEHGPARDMKETLNSIRFEQQTA